MTSKERIQNIKSYLYAAEVPLNVVESFKQVEKDLEVFDIIIKHFAGTIKEKEEDGYEYRVSFVEDAEQNYGFVNLLIDEKEYEIIKRWMHDDKG